MPKFTHLIFDLDGTLLHTLPELLYNINLTFAKLGLPGAFNEAEMATFIGSGKDEQIRRAMRARNIPETEFERINALLSVLYAENTTNLTQPFPGVNEVLAALKAKNIPLYVATNKPESIAKDVVKHFFGSDYFLLVRGDRGDGIIKPDPHFLGSLVEELNVDLQELLFVGDSSVDFLTAKNAGVQCVIVPHGYDSTVLAVSDPGLIKLAHFKDLLNFV